MPRSKHRRKPGGKAVKHPGRGKPPRASPPDPETELWRRFETQYTAPFDERFPDDPLGAGYMLSMSSDLAFVPAEGGQLVPASKAEVFREFMEPVDFVPPGGETPPPKHETPESAEAALAFLVEQGMVLVTGDEITVPARFWTGTQADAAEQPHDSTTLPTVAGPFGV